MTPSTPQVIVVGAGLAGLVTGWRLARRGARVRLLEAAARAGGRLRGERQEGFDLSPALGTLCEADRALARFVAEVGLGEGWQPLRPVGTAIVCRGAVRDLHLRGLSDARRIPGVGLRQGLRLQRLPRLMKRYADALDFEEPAAAARLDDRSLTDFGRLYFGAPLLDRWLAPRAERAGPGDVHEMSRVQFLIDTSRRGSERVGLPRIPLDDVLERVTRQLPVRLGSRALAVEAAATAGSALRVVSEAGTLEADAVVLATGAGEASEVAAAILVPAERDHLRGVRYAPLLCVAAGLCRPPASRPREIWVPRSEGSPLCRVLFEPGLPGGRVPEGRGLAWLRAGGDFEASSRELSDGAVGETLLQALDGLLPGWLRSVDFSRVFRIPRAAPRFDVGHYRALARFESVQRDRRSAGRRLYFAGDHLVHPSAEGAVVSGERAARAVALDLGLS